MREKMYAARIARRTMTILEVPERYREGVMELLSDSDRERQQRLMEEA